jgi:hypothetical protein
MKFTPLQGSRIVAYESGVTRSIFVTETRQNTVPAVLSQKVASWNGVLETFFLSLV